MKKAISLLLAVIICFSLCACGANNDSNKSPFGKNDSEAYIGTWVYDTQKGNIITYHFNKGGIGYWEQSTKSGAKWEFTWEVKDGVVVTTRNAVGTTFLDSFELNDELNALYLISDGNNEGPYKKMS